MLQFFCRLPAPSPPDIHHVVNGGSDLTSFLVSQWHNVTLNTPWESFLPPVITLLHLHCNVSGFVMSFVA